MSHRGRASGPADALLSPIPFPRQEALRRAAAFNRQDNREQIGDDALASLDHASRRMDDLARELNCLGYFDDDDGPRAA
jgi:hypothetical protein